MVGTERKAEIEHYFQQIQERIKELLFDDSNIKKDDIEKFNNLIFDQNDYDVNKDIQHYVEDSFTNSVDIDIVAKGLIDRFYDKVFLNNFNKDTKNDIPNNLEERKIMTFEKYIVEGFEDTNISEPIKVIAWLKNNDEWWYPTKKVDLTSYDNIELLSKGGYHDDIFYAWDDNNKLYGRLFKGRWNNGKKI